MQQFTGNSELLLSSPIYTAPRGGGGPGRGALAVDGSSTSGLHLCGGRPPRPARAPASRDSCLRIGGGEKCDRRARRPAMSTPTPCGGSTSGCASVARGARDVAAVWLCRSSGENDGCKSSFMTTPVSRRRHPRPARRRGAPGVRPASGRRGARRAFPWGLRSTRLPSPCEGLAVAKHGALQIRLHRGLLHNSARAPARAAGAAGPLEGRFHRGSLP